MTTLTREAPTIEDRRSAVAAKERRNLADLDYRREVFRLRGRGYTQAQIADALLVSQPTVSGILSAPAPALVPAGFSGATPLEICQRFAAGLINRDQLLDELGRFLYSPEADYPAAPDDFLPDGPGAASEVTYAFMLRYIDDDSYNRFLDMLAQYDTATRDPA